MKIQKMYPSGICIQPCALFKILVYKNKNIITL